MVGRTATLAETRRAPRYRRSGREKLADVALHVCIIVVILSIVLPFAYIISMSVSNPIAVLKQQVWLWPKGFSLKAYGAILTTTGFLQAYFNTLWYTVVGTAINLVLTVCAAYPLSRRSFMARNVIMTMIVLTMFFNGGIIPTFVLIEHLGLYDTRWVMVLPSAANAFLIIIARTFFQTSIPESLIEAARIDGANDISILWRVVLPMSKPIIAVLALFYAVAHWEDYFTALVYLPSQNLQPLSIYLSDILLQNNQALLGDAGATSTVTSSAMGIQLKYAIIVAVILPIVCIYPFLQKHFVKGVMVGGIKE